MERDYLISNKAYDWLKALVQVILPGVGALYSGLAVFWGFPKAFEVVGSIAVIATFLGLFLGLASKSYNNSDAKYDAELLVTPERNMFDSKKSMEELEKKDEFKVKVREVDSLPGSDG